MAILAQQRNFSLMLSQTNSKTNRYQMQMHVRGDHQITMSNNNELISNCNWSIVPSSGLSESISPQCGLATQIICRIKFIATTILSCFYNFINNSASHPLNMHIDDTTRTELSELMDGEPPQRHTSPSNAGAYRYHEPPPGVDYSDSPTVYGDILDGNLPAWTYQESAELLAFRDRYPKAKLHAFIIPKRFIRNVYSLSPGDVGLVQEMRLMALQLVEAEQPKAFDTTDYILCFHIPPCKSVDHLHLHVLAPASEMSFSNQYIKYNCRAVWCNTDLEVIERLKLGQMAVPYK